MTYFDTDFWINYFVEQTSSKHNEAKKIFEKVSKNGFIGTSYLNIQETAFVLGKLEKNILESEQIINEFWQFEPVHYSKIQFQRAITLAKIIGFKNINDCLHTAIAEQYCKELYTFNRRDFDKIKEHTKLKIIIL